jgi:hypothetical protein
MRQQALQITQGTLFCSTIECHVTGFQVITPEPIKPFPAVNNRQRF